MDGKKVWRKFIFPFLSVQGIELTNLTIIKINNFLKVSGKFIGGAGVFVGGVDIYKNKLNFSNYLHTTMSIIGLIPGGQMFSGGYFLGDLVFKVIYGKNIGEFFDDTLINPTFIDSPIKTPEMPYRESEFYKNYC